MNDVLANLAHEARLRSMACARLLRTALLLLWGPVALPAQQQDTILKRQLLNGMFPPKEARAILDVFAEVEAAGLPTGQLASQVRVAVNKGAEGTEVLRLVHDFRADLAMARAELGTKAGANEIETAATALRMGMSVPALRGMRNARPTIGPSVPVAVATSLARHGIPIETVAADLTPLLSAGVSDGSLQELVARVMLATALGNPVLPAYREQLRFMQHNRVIALGEPGGNPVATFVVRDSSVFIRAGGESVWLSPTINCMVAEGQPPAVTTHAQVQELVHHWVEESKSMREKTEAPPGVATVLTQDTATIAGVHTRRLNITDGGVFEGEMWVAPTEVPASIREAGQRLLAALPPDYWRWVHGHPGYSEIILAYGIPLRHRSASGKDLQLLPSGSSAPSWVDPLQAACAQKHAVGGQR